MPATVADAMGALWDAIDNWPALSGAFTEKLRFDGDNAMQGDAEPSISDFPCLAIDLVSVGPKPFTTQLQQWDVVFAVQIWTQDWNYDPALELIDKVIAAIHKCCPTGSTVPYIKTATGFYIDSPIPIDFKRVSLQDADGGGTLATMTTLKPTLRINRNPFV